MKELFKIAITAWAATAAACSLSADRTSGALGDEQEEDDGWGTCASTELDLPYDIKIQCGDPVIPVLAAFREKNGDQLQFAPAPGTTPDCPFVIEDATIRADEITTCQPFTATEADANTEGNKDTGRDRVWVTWCWYEDGMAAADDGTCCVLPEAESNIVCETEHLDIRFACDGGEGVPPGADQPLDSAAVPAICECNDPDDCGGSDDGACDDPDGCNDGDSSDGGECGDSGCEDGGADDGQCDAPGGCEDGGTDDGQCDAPGGCDDGGGTDNGECNDPDGCDGSGGIEID